MKILKKAQQKNVELNKDWYSESQIKMMLLTEEIFFFGDLKEYGLDELYDFDKANSETMFRVFTENLAEIKVVLDDYGYYETVGVGKNGKVYHIVL